jgi:pteridine reductase
MISRRTTAPARSRESQCPGGVRVNAIAPGFILLPEDDGNVETSNDLLGRIPLGRQGDPGGIAAAVLFLAQGAPYVTGEVITVDGGRKLT